MIDTLAVHGYRSLRDVVLPLAELTTVTGANGSGKSNLYRAFHLLADTATGRLIGSLAAAGGLSSVLWAGPEQITGAMRRGEVWWVNFDPSIRAGLHSCSQNSPCSQQELSQGAPVQTVGTRQPKWCYILTHGYSLVITKPSCSPLTLYVEAHRLFRVVSLPPTALRKL